MASKRKQSSRAQRKQAIALAMAAVRLARLANTLAGAKRRRRGKRSDSCKRCGKPKGAPGAMAIGSVAVGSFALGASASGAAAFGAVAIKRLAVKRASVKSIEIGRLKVGTLEVGELITPSTREAAVE